METTAEIQKAATQSMLTKRSAQLAKIAAERYPLDSDAALRCFRELVAEIGAFDNNRTA